MTDRWSNEAVIDLTQESLRAANTRLQSQNGTSEGAQFRVLNPGGAHALACGLDSPVRVEIDGHAGYFCAGMNKRAIVEINGNAGQGVAENMMSGTVRVRGDASQSAGANGNAAARCGISLKGADIVVKGNVGHMSMFMAQAGRLVVLGDAGDALGDSIYEARMYVRGSVEGLGADCAEKPLDAEHRRELEELLGIAGCEGVDSTGFKRYGSSRQLYNFKVENVGQY
ncbi:MAG: protein GlxC [Rhodobacteraceae bacterium]|nr:protein GlxC [Paracoccaceae bacterium]